MLTATVTPANKASSIAFSITNAEASVSITNVNSTTGVVSLTVKALAGTPDSEPDGDAKLVASGSGGRISGIIILVIKPTSVQVPPSDAQNIVWKGWVDGVNTYGTRDTSPAFPGITPGNCTLYTGYTHWMTITVLDQFGTALDSLFTDTKVTEDGGTINQKLADDGTYQDPVGHPVFKNGSQQTPLKVGGNDNPDIAAWLAASPLPIPGEHDDARTAVEIGGISLSPAIDSRGFVIGSDTNSSTYNFVVLWPDPGL